MADKTECPGCRSYTSSVRVAFNNDQPCPECGLSASAAIEIFTVRNYRANEAATAALEEALIRAGKAETEVRSLRRRLEAIESAVRGEQD